MDLRDDTDATILNSFQNWVGTLGAAEESGEGLPSWLSTASGMCAVTNVSAQAELHLDDPPLHPPVHLAKLMMLRVWVPRGFWSLDQEEASTFATSLPALRDAIDARANPVRCAPNPLASLLSPDGVPSVLH